MNVVSRHRVGLGAALAALGLLATGTVVPQERTESSAAGRLERLSAGVEASEAIKAVKRVQHAYGHYAELGLWNDLADLFTEEAVAYYPTGTFTGRERLRSLYVDEIGPGAIGLAPQRLYPHIMLSPVVTLDADGNTARGRWHLIGMLGRYGGNATWAGGIYENVYVREGGAWKIAEIRYYGQYSGPYATGWRNDKEETAETVAPVPFHYDVTRAGTPHGAATQPRGTPPQRSFAQQAALLAELEARLAQMNDASAVQSLQNAYGYYVDRQRWDDVADLFADDGTLEIGLGGVYVGKASIRRGLDRFGAADLQPGELFDHVQLQTVVTVGDDGRKAAARGTELAMIGVNGEGGRFELGIFENDFVKEGGVWKIAAMHVYTEMITDYAKGWAVDAQPPPGPSAEFPPDRPPSETYAAYPEAFVPAFHYDNPATGKAAQYPQDKPRSRETVLASKPARARAAPRTPAELETRLAEAERALAIAQAYDGAENIANAYGYYIDEFLWNDMADTFAVNGWKELSNVGTYVGRERIRESTMRRYRTVGRRPNSLVIHQKTQPVITVAADGQSARIRTRLFQMNSSREAVGSWLMGVYENQVVLENGVWKIQEMDLDYTWSAGYANGWANVPAPAAPRAAPANPLPDFPPDRPLRGPAAAPYPDVAEMRFHYRNPVSGR